MLGLHIANLRLATSLVISTRDQDAEVQVQRLKSRSVSACGDTAYQNQARDPDLGPLGLQLWRPSLKAWWWSSGSKQQSQSIHTESRWLDSNFKWQMSATCVVTKPLCDGYTCCFRCSTWQSTSWVKRSSIFSARRGKINGKARREQCSHFNEDTKILGRGLWDYTMLAFSRTIRITCVTSFPNISKTISQQYLQLQSRLELVMS